MFIGFFYFRCSVFVRNGPVFSCARFWNFFSEQFITILIKYVVFYAFMAFFYWKAYWQRLIIAHRVKTHAFFMLLATLLKVIRLLRLFSMNNECVNII